MTNLALLQCVNNVRWRSCVIVVEVLRDLCDCVAVACRPILKNK